MPGVFLSSLGAFRRFEESLGSGNKEAERRQGSAESSVTLGMSERSERGPVQSLLHAQSTQRGERLTRSTSDPPRLVGAASPARPTASSSAAGTDESPLSLEAERGELLLNGRARAARTLCVNTAPQDELFKYQATTRAAILVNRHPEPCPPGYSPPRWT